MKKRQLFSPDDIQTQISQAVNRDLGINQHVYYDSHDPVLHLRQRLAREFDKKYVSPLDKDPVRSVDAYLKFLFVCSHMRDNDSQLVFPDLTIERPQTQDSRTFRILKRARLLMHSVLTPLSEDEWYHRCKHGTGTSIGVSYQDTSVEAKSKLPMTVTERAAPYLHSYLHFDNQLKCAVDSFNDKFPIGNWFEIVKGSRATTVPKTKSIDRMIAVEPTGNMFLQLGLMSAIYSRMEAVGLDLASLPNEHKERARLSSVSSEEATIDWSSASDCVSYELLRWLLPPVWFERCNAVRSPSMHLHDGWIDLPMFSTMGNAVTFPLETLVLWTIGHATRLDRLGTLSSYPEWDDLKRVSVFGDDCIIPVQDTHTFLDVCKYVGFIVNKEKSFFGDEGFRESCGGDFLRGYDVRPFYLKGPSSCHLSALEPWLYIIANRLIPKYMSCFGTRDYIYKDGFFGALSDIFQKYNLRLKVVPEDYPDDAGLKITCDLERLTRHYRFTMNPVSVDQHGTYRFNFCRYRYWQRKNKFGDLRYWRRLKQDASRALEREAWGYPDKLLEPVRVSQLPDLRDRVSSLRNEPWYLSRRRGGYVVARGSSAHWALPTARP